MTVKFGNFGSCASECQCDVNEFTCLYDGLRFFGGETVCIFKTLFFTFMVSRGIGRNAGTPNGKD